MKSIYDEVGYWSEIKLDIIKEYASAYSTILTAQKNYPFHHIYIDAFAGSGTHISKNTREFIAGSPQNALLIEPPFREYHLIDLDIQKIKSLEELSKSCDNVYIYHRDCNEVMINTIIPKVKYEDFQRALCILEFSKKIGGWSDNVWIGVTVEAKEYKNRVDILKKIDASVKFLSCEPLLNDLGILDLEGIDWVIVGGESGFNARPMHSEWAVNIRNQCTKKCIPYFFKQWGGIHKKVAGRLLEGMEWNQMPFVSHKIITDWQVQLV